MARQLTMYVYEVGYQDMAQAADGRYDLVQHPVCEVEDSALTHSDIRKILKDQGVDLKRGTDVYAHKVKKVLYKFTTEALKSVAESREELPLE